MATGGIEVPKPYHPFLGVGVNFSAYVTKLLRKQDKETPILIEAILDEPPKLYIEHGADDVHNWKDSYKDFILKVQRLTKTKF